MRRDLLDDLLADVPEAVSVRPDAAWRAGRGRRVRARAAAAGVLVGCVALVVAVVASLAPPGDVEPADGDRGGVEGYPQRIGDPWFLGDLPDRPGPLAGLVEATDFRWLGVDARGRLAQLPDEVDGLGVYPVLSRDGTSLAHLTGEPGATRLMIQDLIGGRQVTFDAVGGPEGLNDARYFVGIQVPGWFSPDGRSLLMLGGTRAGSRPAQSLVMSWDGSVRVVPGDGYPAGWVDDDSIVLYESGPRSAGRATVRDLDGGIEASVEIDALREPQLNQWSATVSPDGTRLAVLVDDPRQGTARLEVVDLSSGRLVVGQDDVDPPASACPIGWVGGEPLLPGTAYADASVWNPDSGLLLSPGVGDAPVVVADPRLDVSCSIWATDALAGSAHRGLPGLLFGTSELRIWWYWREGLLGLGALGGLLVGVLAWRRRRRLTPGRTRDDGVTG